MSLTGLLKVIADDPQFQQVPGLSRRARRDRPWAAAARM